MLCDAPEYQARDERALGMNLDSTLREFSKAGGEPVGHGDYNRAYDAADPKWTHCGMFVSEDGRLYWHYLGQCYRKQLTASDLALLPKYFLAKKSMPTVGHTHLADAFQDMPRRTHALLRRAFAEEESKTPADQRIYFPLRWRDELGEQIAANAMHRPH